MEAFSHFERIINAVVWKQQPDSTLNYLCSAPNCYATCGVKHSVAGVFLLFPRQFSLCSKCNHPHLSHFHLRSKWVQVHEGQVSVDDNMRKQWEAAKNDKERTDALLATSRSALDDLRRSIDEAMDELARLAGAYACLSLSGSFSAPLEKAIRLLEQRCNGMEEKGVSLELLAKVRESLEHMRGRLDLLEKVRVGVRKVQEGIRKAKGSQVTVPKIEEAPEEVQKVDASQETVPKIEEAPAVVQKVDEKDEGVHDGLEKGEGEAQEGLWKVWETFRVRARNLKLWG